MEKQIVARVLSSESLKSLSPQDNKKLERELFKHFIALSATAKAIGINIDDLWRAYIAKCEYNQLDTREGRSITHNNQVEKIKLAEQEKIRLQDPKSLRAWFVLLSATQIQEEYISQSLQTVINGYDITTQQIRQMNRDTEFALTIFQGEEGVKTLSAMVPPYIKFRVLKCSDVYFVDIPNQCIDKFPGLFIMLIPKKTTVMVGIHGYSPQIEIPNVTIYSVGMLQIALIDAGTAEQIDEEHINKFWFFENYSPKRKYHFIYSNSKRTPVQAVSSH